METYCPWNPFVDTTFSELFGKNDIAKLYDIKVGMSKEEVVTVLGEPRNKGTYKNGTEYYEYTGDGASIIGDWAWFEVRFEFRNDVLVEKRIGWVHD
jgi:hypothetical protein